MQKDNKFIYIVLLILITNVIILFSANIFWIQEKLNLKDYSEYNWYELNNKNQETNNQDEEINNLKEEIKSLENKIQLLEKENKKLQDDYLDSQKSSEENQDDIKSTNDKNVSWPYSDWLLFKNDVWEWVTVERFNNSVILRFNGEEMVTYSDRKLYELYRNNPFDIVLIWDKINHLIENSIILDWKLLKIKRPFRQYAHEMDYIDTFVVDEENWYFYDIWFHGSWEYVTRYEDAHFAYLSWQDESAIYKLHKWKVERLDFCGNPLDGKWYKRETFSINEDGSYNYVCH